MKKILVVLSIVSAVVGGSQVQAMRSGDNTVVQLFGISKFNSLAKKVAEHSLQMILEPAGQAVASVSPIKYITTILGLQFVQSKFLGGRARETIRLIKIALALGAAYSYWQGREKELMSKIDMLTRATQAGFDQQQQSFQDLNSQAAANLGIVAAAVASVETEVGNVKMGVEGNQRAIAAARQDVLDGMEANGQRVLEGMTQGFARIGNRIEGAIAGGNEQTRGLITAGNERTQQLVLQGSAQNIENARLLGGLLNVAQGLIQMGRQQQLGGPSARPQITSYQP